MKLFFFFSFFLIFYFIYGFYIAQTDLIVVPEKIRKDSVTRFYDYRGVQNVHTQLSLGSGSIQDVVKGAKASELDFLILSDLNTFDTPNQDSYNDNLLLLVGGKYSYLDSRLLRYSLRSGRLGSNLGESQIQIADLLTKKPSDSPENLLLLAHPYKSGFNWNGEFPSGFDGFELVNVKSLANRSWELSKLSVLWTLFIYPFNPRLSFIRLFNEPSEELELLDQLSETRKTVVVAGAEASARAIPWSNYLMRFPSYETSFELFTNHVLLRSELTGQLEADKQKLFQALKNGNSYIAFDLIGNPRGFYAVVEDKNSSHLMGSEIPFKDDLELKIHLPSAPLYFYEVVIYRNGHRQATFNSTDVIWKITEPGNYRIQVRVSLPLPLPDTKKWVTWIYTNPFFIE